MLNDIAAFHLIHNNRWQKKTLSYVFICLFLIFFSVLIFGSKQLSLTSDEPPHIAHGYLMLKTGDPWALVEHRHPPLSNMLSASLLLLQPEQPDPMRISSWGEDFVLFVRALWPQLGPIERLAYVTRYPNILFSIILLALVIKWSKNAAGSKAAIFAAVLTILDPTLVAHAQLNTTDIGLTLFAFLAMYFVEATSIKNNTVKLGVTGVAMGCALATKASGLILVPVVFAVLMWRIIENQRIIDMFDRNFIQRNIPHYLFECSIVLFCSFVCLAAVYAIPCFVSGKADFLSGLGAHIELILMTLSERYRSAFLAGEIRQGGWWWYFPFAFLIKTPIPSLIFTCITVLLPLTKPKKLLEKLSFWLFPFTYLLFSIRSNMNIGYRHLLPVFPYLYIAAGKLLKDLVLHPEGVLPFVIKSTTLMRSLRTVTILLLIWQAVSLLWIYPFPIAYFNAFAGGPRNGYRYLVDSNVDWGQSFIALKHYLEKEGIPWTWLSYYTWIDPAVYGINYQPLPPANGLNTIVRPYNPAPGTYALSATTLQGVMMADPNLYNWFRHKTPTAQPGYGLLLYQIDAQDIQPGWVAQCSRPVSPLSSSDIEVGFGIENMRLISFDCESAWIYPQQLTQPGWYVLHMDAVNNYQTFYDSFLNYSRLSFEQTASGILPAFTVYETEKDYLQPDHYINTSFGDGKLTLAGYVMPDTVPQKDGTLEIITWWWVQNIPDRPLSLMLHLSHSQTGETYVGDGLGVPVTEWRKDDIIVQRHSIYLPQQYTTGVYNVLSGVYWLDSLERWIPADDGNVVNDAVVLTQINLD
jgi:hypothetical protein